MISKRQEADRQFSRHTSISREKQGEKTISASQAITDADKKTRDLKTTGLREQREAKAAKGMPKHPPDPDETQK